MAGSTPASPIAEAAAIVVAPARVRHESLGREAWRRFRRHRLALVSAGILAVMVLVLVFGTVIWPVAINEIDFSAMQQGQLRQRQEQIAHPHQRHVDAAARGAGNGADKDADKHRNQHRRDADRE